MCPTPKPVYDFGQRVIGHLVNRQLDLVDNEIERFRKKGYIIYYRTISREEYESSHFIENAGKIMQEAKNNSNGWKYNGILVFYPFIKGKNWKSLFNPNKPSLFFKTWQIIFQWSMHFNEDVCLSNALLNKSSKFCTDTNIHLMVFYFKGGLNWK